MSQRSRSKRSRRSSLNDALPTALRIKSNLRMWDIKTAYDYAQVVGTTYIPRHDLLETQSRWRKALQRDCPINPFLPDEKPFYIGLHPHFFDSEQSAENWVLFNPYTHPTLKDMITNNAEASLSVNFVAWTDLKGAVRIVVPGPKDANEMEPDPDTGVNPFWGLCSDYGMDKLVSVRSRLGVDMDGDIKEGIVWMLTQKTPNTKSLLEQINECLDKCTASASLEICGNSLGGVVATIIAMIAAKRSKFARVTLYLFGPFPTFNVTGAAEFEKLGVETHNFQFINDLPVYFASWNTPPSMTGGTDASLEERMEYHRSHPESHMIHVGKQNSASYEATLDEPLILLFLSGLQRDKAKTCFVEAETFKRLRKSGICRAVKPTELSVMEMQTRADVDTLLAGLDR